MMRPLPLVVSFAAGCALTALLMQPHAAVTSSAVASLPSAAGAIGPVASSVELSPAATTFAAPGSPPTGSPTPESPPAPAAPPTPGQAPPAAAVQAPAAAPPPTSTGGGAALGPVPLLDVPTRATATVPEQGGSPVVARPTRPAPPAVMPVPVTTNPAIAGRIETGSGMLGQGVVGMPGFGPTPQVPANLPPGPVVAYGQQPALYGRPVYPPGYQPTLPGGGYAQAPMVMAPGSQTPGAQAMLPPGVLPPGIPPGAVAIPVPSAAQSSLDGPRTEWQDMHGPGHAADASTITIGSRIVRLYGIRPPAAADRCQIAGGEAGSCRDIARRRLEARIALAPDLTCRAPADGSSRGPGSICLDGTGTDLAGDLVGAGLAYADGGSQSDYGGAEEVARSVRRGVWSMR